MNEKLKKKSEKWEMVKLGEVAEILNGYAFKSENYVDNGIRVIRITNVQKGYIEDNQPEFYSLSELEQIRKYELFENDLLISLTGNVGRVALLNKNFLPAALNQRVGCIRIKNISKIDKLYLFSFLNSNIFEKHCVESSKGVAQKNMSTEWLKEYKIPLPPLEIQKEIANELDKITSLIEKRKSQIEKLDLLIKAKFVEMFGKSQFDVFKLNEISDKITDGTHQSPNFIENGVPFLLVSNIVNYKINYETKKFISDEEYHSLIKRTPIEIGDLLLTTVGSYGNPAIIESEKPFCFQRHIGYIKPKKNIVNSFYLKFFFLSPYGKEQIETRVKGIAQKTLNISELKTILIPLPPLDLQNKFAEFVENVEKTKQDMQKGLQQLELLCKERMQEYFE